MSIFYSITYKYMEHLSKHCSANNLFLTSDGLQCGNCLSIDLSDKDDKFIDRYEKATGNKVNRQTKKHKAKTY